MSESSDIVKNLLNKDTGLLTSTYSLYIGQLLINMNEDKGWKYFVSNAMIIVAIICAKFWKKSDCSINIDDSRHPEHRVSESDLSERPSHPVVNNEPIP